MTNGKVQIVIEALNKTREAFKSLSDEFKAQTRNADNFKLKATELDNFLKAGIGIGALYKLTTEIKTALDTFERFENSIKGLAAISRYSGEDMGKSINAAAKLAEDGLIDVQGAAQALQNLLSRGFSLQESFDIITRLKDAAAFNRQSHLSMSDAVKSATEGLKNENSILVDNAGVTKNVSVMWKEYAAQIGKGADSLTQAEKRTAEYNGIMRETEGQIGNAKLATEGLTGAKARLSVEIFKLRAALGESLAPAFGFVGKIALWAIDVLKAFLGGIEITGARIGLWVEKISVLWNFLKNGKQGLLNGKTLSEEFARLNQVFDAEATRIAENWEGKIEVPNIGADSGKRRQDITLPDKKGAEAAAAAEKKRQQIVEQLRESTMRLQVETGKLSAAEMIEYETLKKLADLGDKKAKADLRKLAIMQMTPEQLIEETKRLELLKLEREEEERSIKTFEAAEEQRKKALEERYSLEEQLLQVEKDIWEGSLTGNEDAIEVIKKRYEWERKLLEIQRQRLIAQGYGLGLDKDELSIIDEKIAGLPAKEAGEISREQDKKKPVDDAAKRRDEFYNVLENALGDFMETGKFSWQKLWADFRGIASKSFSEMLLNWFKSLDQMESSGQSCFVSLFEPFSNIFSSWFGAGAPDWTGIDLPAYGYHTGGTGNEGTYRPLLTIPAWLPRAHTGLGPHERVTVTLDDETIFTQGQMKALGNVIGGKTQQPPVYITINATDAQSFQNMLRSNPRAIADAVASAVRMNHPVRRSR